MRLKFSKINVDYIDNIFLIEIFSKSHIIFFFCFQLIDETENARSRTQRRPHWVFKFFFFVRPIKRTDRTSMRDFDYKYCEAAEAP